MICTSLFRRRLHLGFGACQATTVPLRLSAPVFLFNPREYLLQPPASFLCHRNPSATTFSSKCEASPPTYFERAARRSLFQGPFRPIKALAPLPTLTFLSPRLPCLPSLAPLVPLSRDSALYDSLRELDHANMKTMKSRRPAGADRGGIRKRGPTRTDRDGDMDMDSAGARGGKRARTSTGRSSTAGRAQPQGMADAIQKAIASNSGAQANVRQGRKGKAPNRDNLEQFSVRGWKESKAASNSDGGLESLIAFLERRMNAHSKTGPRAKISKVCSPFDMAVPSHEIRHPPPPMFCSSPRMATP